MQNRFLGFLVGFAVVLLAGHAWLSYRPTPNTTTPRSIETPTAKQDTSVVPHMWQGQQGLVRVFISLYPDSLDPRGEKLRLKMEDSLRARGFEPSRGQVAEKEWGVMITPLEGGVARARIGQGRWNTNWKEFKKTDSVLVTAVLGFILSQQ
jgi:hypothetical protein